MKKFEVRYDQLLVGVYGVHVGIALYLFMTAPTDDLRVMWCIGLTGLAIGVIYLMDHLLGTDGE